MRLNCKGTGQDKREKKKVEIKREASSQFLVIHFKKMKHQEHGHRGYSQTKNFFFGLKL
jgi:hypothetical protein